MLPADLDDLPAARGLAAAVSPHYGLIRHVNPCTAPAGLPPVPILSTDAANPVPTLWVDVTAAGGGAAVGYPAAALSGTGEAVERYSAGFVPYSQLLFGTAAELDVPVTAAGDWALFAPGQQVALDDEVHPFGHADNPLDGFQNLRADHRLGWVRASRLDDGQPSAVPAQWVYLGYVRGPAEPLLCWTTSTGLACGQTYEQAVLGGLLEVIERDAFLRTWRQRLTMPTVSVDGLLDQHPWLSDAFTLPGGPRLTVVDLTAMSVAPTMLATIRHPHLERPAFAVGAATALTRAAAARKAVVEVCHTLHYAVGLRFGELCVAAASTPGRGRVIARPIPQAEDFDRHVWTYVARERAERTAFLDAGPLAAAVDWDEQPTDDDAHDVSRKLASQWRDDGVETYAVDVTSPDVADLGLAVARVVSPQAAQLDVAGGGPYLGQPRLLRVNETQILDVSSLNTDPHPFP